MSLIKALEEAIANLTVDEKLQVFGVLKWNFACLSCEGWFKVEAYPAKYPNFTFWGDEVPAMTALRAGPCETCVSEGRKGQRGGVGYKVVTPSSSSVHKIASQQSRFKKSA